MGDMLFLAGHDYTDVDAKADLLGGVLRLRRGSWIPQIGDVGGAPVVETFDLVSEETNANTIAELSKIEALLELARTYPLNPVQAGGAWLEWGIDAEPRVAAETGYPAKRAWIYDGKLQLAGVGGLPGPFMDQKAVGKLAVRRHPLWENLEPVADSASAVAWGDVVDLTGLQTEMGTAPGRIQQAIMEASTSAINEFWLGLRPLNYSIDYFDPLWELENGTNGTDTSDQVDATASGGDNVTCTFATSTALVERVRISVNNVDPLHPGDFVGRYLVLVRAKVGSSTECGIVMRYGSANAASRIPAEEIYIDNTSWELIELGEIVIPAPGYRDDFGITATSIPQFSTISLDAERLTGSGSLYMDCLYLIPSDHLIHGKYPDTPSSVLELRSYILPNDRISVYLVEDVNESILDGETSAQIWHLPVDVAGAVGAVQRNGSHVLTDTFDLDLVWFPRWKLYRES